MDEKKTTRRRFLQSIGASAALLAAKGCTKISLPRFKRPSKKPPNILFICTDYQSGADGPSLGSPFLYMPFLDRLCREGAVFERHYSTAPVCMPARYTWITGTYPHTHGAWDNVGNWLPEGQPILMEELHKAGYYSLGIGKMHFSPWDRMAGFDRRIIADRKGNGRGDNYMDDYAKFLSENGLSRWDYLKLQSPGEDDIFGVYDWPYDEKFHIDVYVGDQAKTVIENRELKKPWFLWVSFNGPHNPWDPPARCSERYKKMDLPIGKTVEGELKNKPIDQTNIRYNYTRDVVDRMDSDPENRDKIIRRIRAGHFGNLALIDEQLGRIIKALEKTNQLDNTIIIYTSDHGSMLGDHNLIHKGTFYDRSARVPFVVRFPKEVSPMVTSAFTSHVDIMPTILSLAGAAIPDSVEGKEVSPVFLGRKQSVQDFLILEIRGATCIVTDRWKMSVYPQYGDGELYDLKNEPDEFNNLFNRPQYAEIQKMLLGKMTGVNPKLSEQLGKTAEIIIEDKSEFVLKQGDDLPARTAPYCGGKNLSIEADIKPDESSPYDGVVVSQLGYQHGYILYVHQGQIIFVLKRWGKFNEVCSGSLENKPVKIIANVSNDGKVTLMADGSHIAEGQADCFWPEQPGKKTIFTTAALTVGFVSNQTTIANLNLRGNLTGTVEKLLLKLS
jgi:choline-sulfatase